MLTIFTPTFNRAHTLPRLYESLLNQTDYNFEWLIVDDGSSDDTSNLIETFKDEKFPIRYIYQNNGGKHIASNVGLKAAKGDIFVVLDSDDWFYPNAVQVFNEKFKNNEDMKALITLDTYENGDVVGEKLPKIEKVNWVDLRYKYKVRHDKCYVFKTSIIRNMTFPQYGSSKHMPPSYQWFEFSELYDCYLSNINTKYVEYQEDGISSKVKTNYFKSAENYCEYRKLAHRQLPTNKDKLINYLLYDISWIDTGLNPKYRFKDTEKFITSLVLTPFALLLYYYYKLKFKRRGLID
ncbi:glycosyltransferase family A protein [Staphylococcus haemolyticus]|uniref:glycosyltransferase family 2 protein n=1 Tax=Staphylococcus haemolyticus TaxID=1283 RepID=UPI0028A461C4|nr:glycosyltransferase family A protein [Staphylococcus haemolyticus]MDT4190007.1 glycosyltransferase family A protein [Staphylococcus haemolyticus]MDT4195123.1 glycosyltransferase family A protein [Staphylococcus haemolyticus]MDT4197626.1 glycosyltransferase family A protein [Staphylococcus haemolyticus]MDT4205415.1 glycosyltransferase family A protein [Staphylococcus haemolyticus]MDT4207924.1 glycosyltransferase family A protein [Staphylococcus haemolyticus]